MPPAPASSPVGAGVCSFTPQGSRSERRFAGLRLTLRPVEKLVGFPSGRRLVTESAVRRDAMVGHSSLGSSRLEAVMGTSHA
jgi:hypothetical protein